METGSVRERKRNNGELLTFFPMDISQCTFFHEEKGFLKKKLYLCFLLSLKFSFAMFLFKFPDTVCNYIIRVSLWVGEIIGEKTSNFTNKAIETVL